MPALLSAAAAIAFMFTDGWHSGVAGAEKELPGIRPTAGGTVCRTAERDEEKDDFARRFQMTASFGAGRL